MYKIIFIFITVLFFNALNAQESKSSNASSFGSGKLGLGLTLIGPSGITGKYLMNDKMSIEGSLGLHTADAGGEDVVGDHGMGEEVSALLADRLEEVVDGDRKFLFDFHVTDFASAIAFLEVVHFGMGGIECVVVDEDRIAFDRPRVVAR